MHFCKKSYKPGHIYQKVNTQFVIFDTFLTYFYFGKHTVVFHRNMLQNWQLLRVLAIFQTSQVSVLKRFEILELRFDNFWK